MKSERIKICVLIRTLNSGGAEKQSVLLSNALNADYEVHLVVQHGNEVEVKHIEFLQKNKIHFVLLKGGLFKRLNTFYHFLKESDINIIFSYLTSDNFWGAIIGKLAGVEYLVGGIRSIVLPWHKFYVTKFLQRYFLDYLIYNSLKGYDNFIQEGFDKEKAVIIHNYIDPPVSFYKRKSRNVVKVITVARFVEGKDYLTAIKVIHYLISNISTGKIDLQYFIIGFGKLEKQIREWVDFYGLNDHIHIILRPDNLEKYYLESDIYLCTSTEEGLSNSIMEAMSHSLPLVATDAGDNPSLIQDGITGFIVPQRSYKKIASALNEFITSYEKRIDFGLAGFNYIKDEFSYDNFRKKYSELINSMNIKK